MESVATCLLNWCGPPFSPIPMSTKLGEAQGPADALVRLAQNPASLTKTRLLGCVSSVLHPCDLCGFSLDHVLEPRDWIPKRQSPMQLVARWNADQAWNAPVPCPRHRRATGRDYPTRVKVPYAQGVGDKGGILQRQLCICIREPNGPPSMKSQ